MRLVSQICVRGSARGMEKITDNQDNHDSFLQSISLRNWQKNGLGEEYFAGVLKEHKATRFHNEAAKTLQEIARCDKVVKNGKIVIFSELNRCSQDVESLREHLLERCPVLGLKSVSDLMIETGVSDDVIALDTRIVKLLQKHFGYNVGVGRVQNSKELYLSLESALRDLCADVEVPLALFDRMLFRLSGISVVDFYMKHGTFGLLPPFAADAN